MYQMQEINDSSHLLQQHVTQAHLSEAYEDFKERLNNTWKIPDHADFKDLAQELNMIKGNSSAFTIDASRILSCALGCLIIPCIYWQTRTVFEVPDNSFALVESSDDGKLCTEIYAPGFHILGYYKKLIGIYSLGKQLGNIVIDSGLGDLKIAVVDQGSIMHFEQGGQNIILGPGVHLINEPLTFQKVVSLDSFYIEIGPEKWVTVPDGYDGIAINRGKLRVLQGGRQHHLSHVGDKFAKMVPKFLQTDRIPTDITTYVKQVESESINEANDPSDLTLFLQTTTADGSIITIDAMIFWRVVDTEKAAKNAMEMLKINEDNEMAKYNQINISDQIQTASKDITSLRLNVLRQAKAHLTALVGRCSLAGNMSLIEQTYKDPVVGESTKLPFDKQQQQYISEDLLERDHSQSMDELPINKQRLQETGPVDSQNKNTFQILNLLQRQQASVKQLANADLERIGVQLENICIFSVIPSKDIQKELDEQTNAKVDANTQLINAHARRQISEIELQMNSHIAIQKAKAGGNAQLIQAKALADSDVSKAYGQAEGIKIVAKARKDEAEELSQYSIAQELARIRIAGEAGSKIFQGNTNSFIFGQNPGDVLFSMFNQNPKLLELNKKNKM